MNNQEGELLLKKCMRVIISCKNKDQLKLALIFSDMAIRRVSTTIGLANHLNFRSYINQSIGWALKAMDED